MNKTIQTYNQLSPILDSIPVGIVVLIGTELTVASINSLACTIFEIDSEHVIGKNVHDVFKTRAAGILGVINETVQYGQPVKNFTMELKLTDQTRKSFLVNTAFTANTDSENSSVVLVLHDVSEVTKLRKAAIHAQKYGALIGGSDGMQELYYLIQTVAEYDTTVLLQGETGTGKEVVAKTIHEASHRAGEAFIPVHCSALSPTLLESELFGHVKGAFTGAIKERRGRIELANNGTLFLDEVGTLSQDIQIKLLRVIQERVIERVGSSTTVPVNVRVISATNRDLTHLIAKGEFREDLYYRLKVFQINIPVLRDRSVDIPILAEHFLDRYNQLYRKNVIGFSSSTIDLLIKYQWPGNVRELENAIEHALVMSTGNLVEPACLPPEIRFMKANGTPPPPPQQDLSSEEENIRRALGAFAGNVSKAAVSLNMHRTTLWRKMKEFGISRQNN